MGYTHYYQVGDKNSPEWKAAWPKLVRDAQRIIDHDHVPLTGPTENDDEETVTPPLVDEVEGIYLNGAYDGGHEPLIIQCRQHRSSGFTKTARKPYDTVVGCILLRAFMLAPTQFYVGSDGFWEEWKDARDLYASLWPGEAIECPWGE
ncbi:hypothetical protein BO94DRAFT_545968 [Aspergillus sclerotioniger CBS 115572]|uniref:Uncharacterized protein n=1 Tax=Aspergillus sclerotioniger CBS 115572 TaxID=1450535 RepID=A0A317WUM6_9EURO|nr:hypothetical protein BO94DRAFT_545968 [Aspergillus sclerotioniger CBS 115572]PWY88897.1 hypothetical protein BO94DRAFT_545968 [Aspergillus sclerotioniger CBS 115572]